MDGHGCESDQMERLMLEPVVASPSRVFPSGNTVRQKSAIEDVAGTWLEKSAVRTRRRLIGTMTIRT